MSDKNIIYACERDPLNSSGLYFERLIDHPAMPKTKYIRFDAVIELLESLRKDEFQFNIDDEDYVKGFNSGIDEGVEDLKGMK